MPCCLWRCWALPAEAGLAVRFAVTWIVGAAKPDPWPALGCRVGSAVRGIGPADGLRRWWAGQWPVGPGPGQSG